ncbi:dTDP-4-dehydrorhamnose 3,5-epimerase [Candidatus Termititenax persephonae]|uniref:dTDP-4-dehydrorhamnose 3,5-epimerase n=1 Tax=Candidatus Termititenax persephonae TaxID=2218525 RepID=A0A388TFL4_9BACT|nr:dTDP-4-dehydrorhamnose 3,5-epimerase [Candidatus Termititenax persephonae]
MNIIKTALPGLLIIEPQVFPDERGFFYESYSQKALAAAGLDNIFVQDNHSQSRQGTLRGLHFQKGSLAQAKLVRCTFGQVYDVAVDLRRDSPTFQQWLGVTLSAENKKQFFIPRGFAHGFAVLSDSAEFQYKCDAYYAPQAEVGIFWNDPDLKIDWPVAAPLVSAKDRQNPRLKDLPLDCFF